MILLEAKNPSPLTLSGTNTYLLGERKLIVVDPGPFMISHLQSILDHAGKMGTIELILLTHHHPDHAGGAKWLKKETGAQIAAFEKSTFNPDIKLQDNQVLKVDNLIIQALFTPGHSSDHLSFYLAEVNGIFTGDLVLGEGSTTINPPDGNLRDYMNSLERLRKLDALTLFPGHGPKGNAKKKIDEMILHRKERHREILKCLAQKITSPEKIVEIVYGSLEPALLAFALGNVKAHLQAIRENFSF